MGELDIAATTVGDLASNEVDYSVQPLDTEGAEGTIEFRYINKEWTVQFGYYTDIPELRVAVDTKINWIIGAGFEADEQTELLLMTIKGNGKDSFNSILRNQLIIYTIGGDSFAEIIRDEEGVLINLKPMNPGTVEIIQDAKGRIIRYEQVGRSKKLNKPFKPEEIFHLSRNRVADSIKGSSIIPAVKWIIDARNEAMADMRKLMHRHVIPRFKYSLDFDEKDKIAEFKIKEDLANAKGENIYIPKGAVEQEIIAVPTNATLNPLQWIDRLNDYFFQVVNTPQIIVGNAKEFTDASGKIVYLAFEQSVKGEQLYVEEQVLGQLNIEINLTFPASLQNELISDTNKEGEMQASQPNDTTAELEGKE